MMSETWTIDFYEILKKSGMMAEKQLNDWIKERLNQEKVVLQAGKKSKALVKKISKAREHMETLSILLNFPTKNDLAETTNLVIQTEDKVDQVQSSLYDLEQLIEEIKLELKTSQEGNLQCFQQLQDHLNQLKKSTNETGWNPNVNE